MQVTLEEVATHSKKCDVWLFVHGRVLDVSNFLSQHPDGELDILTFARKDASAVFDLIHPSDVIEKYAPFAVIGTIGTSGGSSSAPASNCVSIRACCCGWRCGKEVEGANKNRPDRMDRYGKVGIPVIGPFSYTVLTFMKGIIPTIFGQMNIVLTSGRVGLSRSVIFLFVLVIIHAVGNLHVVGDPGINGYRYCYARLYWTRLGLQENIVEEGQLEFRALLFVPRRALRRTRNATSSCMSAR